MSKPIVAVVGRPNVGKSTLVNRIIGRRDAIVHESRGVTRDRSYHHADWAGRDFVLIDTGGIEPLSSDDVFSTPIREQAQSAVAEADAIVFIVDGTTGTTDEDEVVARILRKSSKPVFLVANKLDDPSRDQELWELYSLGVGEPIPISALHGIGVGDLLDDVLNAIPEKEEDEAVYPEDALNVAVVGRPNAGKSSLVNRISGVERSIVSDVAGTTRDAVDVTVEHNGRTIRLVDTAGMRKRSAVHEDVEYYSIVRGLQALEAADVALLVVDATVGVTEQDQKVAAEAVDRGCGLVLLLNKWDAVDDAARARVDESLAARMTMCSWAPVLRISALSGRSVPKIWDMVEAAADARSDRIPTPAINRLLERLRETGFTRVQGSKRLKVNYATQTGVNPPVFTFFCNAPELADDNYRRYLENRLRETFDLVGTPIRLKFRKKEG